MLEKGRCARIRPSPAALAHRALPRPSPSRAASIAWQRVRSVRRTCAQLRLSTARRAQLNPALANVSSSHAGQRCSSRRRCVRPALLPELPPDFCDYELLEPPPPLRHCCCRLLRLSRQPQREAGSAARAAAARGVCAQCAGARIAAVHGTGVARVVCHCIVVSSGCSSRLCRQTPRRGAQRPCGALAGGRRLKRD